MSNKVIKGSRKLGSISKTYKKGDIFLHPLTLQFKTVTKDNTTPTNFYYDKNQDKISMTKTNINEGYSNEEIQKYTSLPYLNLDTDLLIYFYDIDTIDKFNKNINLKLDNNTPPDNLIRIINIWIKYNFDDLKKHNNYLSSLFSKINDKYYNLNYDKNKVNQYIDNWINNKNINDFEFNLFADIFKFINK